MSKQVKWNLAWRRKNPEKWKEIQRGYRKRHREELLKKSAERYLKNREKIASRFRKQYRDNQKKFRDRNRKALYGISSDEYEQLLLRQNYKCAICGRARRLGIDHNHETGEIRGLLCNQCNSRVGWLEKHKREISNYGVL